MGEDSQAPWSQSFLGDPRQTGLPVLHLLISGAVPSGRPAPTPSFKSQTHFPKKRRDHRVVSATGPLQRLFLHWEYHAQSLLGGSFFTRKLGPQRDLGCPPCGPLNTHTLAHSHTVSRPCHALCAFLHSRVTVCACRLHICPPWGTGWPRVSALRTPVEVFPQVSGNLGPERVDVSRATQQPRQHPEASLCLPLFPGWGSAGMFRVHCPAQQNQPHMASQHQQRGLCLQRWEFLSPVEL